MLKLLSGAGLSINEQHVYCGDYIYSGHTMTLVMTFLIIKECEFPARNNKMCSPMQCASVRDIFCDLQVTIAVHHL